MARSGEQKSQWPQGRAWGVAEVADEGGHAALRSFGELDHAVELGAAVGELLLVAGAPQAGVGGAERGADAAFDVELSGALGGELVDGALEVGGEHLELLAERVGGLELVGEEAGDAGEVFDGRVVALEEGLVDFAVGEAVEEDGAGGEAIAAGAADFLVIAFDGGGQRGVEDGADVGLVDAHAEGDGGDDDFELAGEEVRAGRCRGWRGRGRRGRRRTGRARFSSAASSSAPLREGA